MLHASPFPHRKMTKRPPKTWKNSCSASWFPLLWAAGRGKSALSCVENSTERTICSQVPTGKGEHDVALLATAKWQIPGRSWGCQAGLGKRLTCKQSATAACEHPGTPTARNVLLEGTRQSAAGQLQSEPWGCLCNSG